MNLTRLTDTLSVSPQLGPFDMAEAAARGFKVVICNRPDGEAPDQPDFASVAEAAREAGLETAYIPVFPGRMTPENVAEFAAALAAAKGPVLAYCRTGNRCTQIWQAGLR